MTPHPDKLRFRQALLARKLTMADWAAWARTNQPTVSAVLNGTKTSARVATLITRYATRYGPKG